MTNQDKFEHIVEDKHFWLNRREISIADTFLNLAKNTRTEPTKDEKESVDLQEVLRYVAAAYLYEVEFEAYWNAEKEE